MVKLVVAMLLLLVVTVLTEDKQSKVEREGAHLQAPGRSSKCSEESHSLDDQHSFFGKNQIVYVLITKTGRERNRQAISNQTIDVDGCVCSIFASQPQPTSITYHLAHYHRSFLPFPRRRCLRSIGFGLIIIIIIITAPSSNVIYRPAASPLQREKTSGTHLLVKFFHRCEHKRGPLMIRSPTQTQDTKKPPPLSSSSLLIETKQKM